MKGGAIRPNRACLSGISGVWDLVEQVLVVEALEVVLDHLWEPRAEWEGQEEFPRPGLGQVQMSNPYVVVESSPVAVPDNGVVVAPT